MGSFSASIRLSSEKVLQKVNSKCYEIAKELFRKVIEFTPSPSNPGPWAKGHLVNQWYTGENGEYSEELSSETDPTGSGSLLRISTLSGNIFRGRDGSLTLVNNLSYAYRAEVLGWPAGEAGHNWKGARPYAMVARALQIIGSKYK